jgi:hypothetical protein
MKRTVLLPPLLVFALACSTASPTPVPVEAAAADSLAPLAGTWTGQYSSDATGRQGSIVFELRADARTATGDVVMYSNVVANPAIPRDRAGSGMTPSATVLKISFVNVAGGEVSGKIEPYADPVTGATLSTTFSGRLSGNTIEGTYENAGAGSGVAPQRGRWKVTRQ